MKFKNILFIIITLGSTNVFADNITVNNNYNQSNLIAAKSMMMKSMKAMNGMYNLKLTGVPSIDFLSGMIPHHEGAIIMCESILPKLTDENIRNLAIQIIKSQKKQVIFMRQWLKHNPLKSTDNINMLASKNMMIKSLKVMHAMQMIHLTSNLNVDLVVGMIPHHEAAVEMAIAILPYLKNKQIIHFANVIIKDQNAQIHFMKQWLNEYTVIHNNRTVRTNNQTITHHVL